MHLHLLRAEGIQYSIDQGSLVQPLIDAGVPSSVGTFQLCGSANDMPGLHNEHTGPSDGAVFIASCRATDGVSNRVDATTLSLNHLELGWAEAAMSQLDSWLSG